MTTADLGARDRLPTRDARRGRAAFEARRWTEAYESLRDADTPEDLRLLATAAIRVLCLIATGRTNRAIADELVISEKSVARHVSDIFTKLGLSSRAVATACAFEQGFV